MTLIKTIMISYHSSTLIKNVDYSGPSSVTIEEGIDKTVEVILFKSNKQYDQYLDITIYETSETCTTNPTTQRLTVINCNPILPPFPEYPPYDPVPLPPFPPPYPPYPGPDDPNAGGFDFIPCPCDFQPKIDYCGCFNKREPDSRPSCCGYVPKTYTNWLYDYNARNARS